MLKPLSFILLLVFFLQNNAQLTEVPGIKFSLDFVQIDVFKTITLKPLVEQYLSNLTIAGPLELNLSLIISNLTAKFSNLEVKQFSLNWDKTMLAPISETKISLTLFDLDIKIENDYEIYFSGLNLKGRANITLTNLTVVIALEFLNLTTGSGFQASISNFTLNYDSITLDVDSQIITWLTQKIFKVFKCMVIQKLTGLIMADLNTQVVALTSQVIQIPVTPSDFANLIMKKLSPNLRMPTKVGDTYVINITMSRAPYVRYFSNSTNNFAYMTFAINAAVFNNGTHETPVVQEYDLLPYRVSFDSDIQAFLCNSLLTQLQWVIIDSGILKLSLDDTMMPKTSPIRLNTTSIMLIVPGMTTKYGTNKGIYLGISAASPYSKIVFRSGRLVGEVSLVLDFYVDKDSSNYPTEGFANCASCEKALSLNATLLVALHADNLNETVIFANIINLDFYYLTVRETLIEFDVASFQTLMKDVGRSFIPTINAALLNIPNPIIGKYGVKNMQFKFSVDYLFLQVVFAEEKAKEYIN